MSRYRIIVVGCGAMADTWVEYALARGDCAITALVDIRIEAARAMAAKYRQSCPCFGSLEAALAVVEANLVFDLTVPGAHHATTTAALRHGCDVMSEKPMTDNAAHAQDIVRLAQTERRFYAVMQNRRYLKGIRDLRAFLDSGVLGRIGFVCVDFFIGAHFDGFRIAMKHPLLLDMAVHTFDMARYIMGADPQDVYCHEFKPKGSWFNGNASAVCLFHMSGGGVFCYRASWCSEGCPTTWEGNWRVQCEKGTLLWDGKNPPRAQKPAVADPPGFLNSAAEIEVPGLYTGREGHEGCLDAMFEALAGGRPAETQGADNLHSIMMSLMSVKSAQAGRRIDKREV